MQLLAEGVVAIGIGLFIGLEREHSDTTQHKARSDASALGADTHESLLGVRTFALLALFGWITGALGESYVWLPAAVLLVLGALIVVAAVRRSDKKRGLTTEVAALTTFTLGMLVHHERALSVSLALATSLLLISKPWFRRLVPRMRRMDLTSTLQLLILLAIVLPLLPEQAIDPWGALSPRRIGIFVALIAGISYVGYILNRLLGSRRSAGVTGVVGGLASSTAVTVAMAQQSRESASMREPGQFATFLSSTVMFGRVLIISSLISGLVAKAVAPALSAMAACTIAGAFWKWKAMRASQPLARQGEPLELTNPFSLVPALKWGAMFAVILVLSSVAKRAMGNAGLVGAAAVSGLVDVDAITLAAIRQAAAGETAVGVAAIAIIVAVISNTVVKAAIAWIGGGKGFGSDVAKVFSAAAVVGLTVSIVLSV